MLDISVEVWPVSLHEDGVPSVLQFQWRRRGLCLTLNDIVVVSTSISMEEAWSVLIWTALCA